MLVYGLFLFVRFVHVLEPDMRKYSTCLENTSSTPAGGVRLRAFFETLSTIGESAGKLDMLLYFKGVARQKFTPCSMQKKSE